MKKNIYIFKKYAWYLVITASFLVQIKYNIPFLYMPFYLINDILYSLKNN